MNGKTFQQWRIQLMHLLGQTSIDEAAVNGLTEKMVSATVVELLQNDRLFGEVLLRIERVYRFDQPGTAGLTWQDDHLQLVINPRYLVTTIGTSDELRGLLMHEVLHVVWQHPLRYQDVRHQQNVSLATDVAINQYLPVQPKGTFTLEMLKELLPLESIPDHADSQQYLQIIENGDFAKSGHDQDNQFQMQTDAPDPTDQNTEQQVGDQAKLDVHSGWQQQERQLNITQQTANLRQLLNDAWQQTPDKERGLLPGDVIQQLEHLDVHSTLNWRQLIKRSLGNMPLGKRDSYSRFNRRQPQRMDLPGQVTNLVINIAIFVDNSGSMGEKEISYLLAQIKSITKVYEARIKVFSFDTEVHVDDAYEMTNQNQIQYERRGGGGTRFQSIFDYLHAIRAQNNGLLAIILTDGWGEDTIHHFGFTNTIWLLTAPKDDFSLTRPMGKVISLNDDPEFQRLVGQK